MICVDKSTGVGAERFLARMPPYLAASLYLTSAEPSIRAIGEDETAEGGKGVHVRHLPISES